VCYSEYVVIGPRPWEANILVGDEEGEEIAEIKKGEDRKSFNLIRKKMVMNGLLLRRFMANFALFNFCTGPK
jgi:hypothetical protein